MVRSNGESGAAPIFECFEVAGDERWPHVGVSRVVADGEETADISVWDAHWQTFVEVCAFQRSVEHPEWTFRAKVGVLPERFQTPHGWVELAPELGELFNRPVGLPEPDKEMTVIAYEVRLEVAP